MDKLIKALREKAKELSKTEIPDKDESEFFSEFLTTYNANIIETYDKVSNVSYVAAVLLSHNISLDFEEFIDLISKVRDIFNNPEVDLRALEMYFQLLKKLDDDGILENCLHNSKDLSKEILQKYKKSNLSKLEKLVCKTGESGTYDITASQALIKLFHALPEPELFMSFNELLFIRDYVRVECNTCFGDFSNLICNISNAKLLSKRRNKIIKNVIKEYIKTNNLKIYQYYELMIKHYEKLYKNVKSAVTDVNRKISTLEKTERRIVEWPRKEMFKFDESFSKLCFDSKIEYEVLLFKIKHNFDIQKQAEQKNREYNDNSITKLDILFSKYGFNFNEIEQKEQNEIVLLEIETVEEILMQIRYSDLTFFSEYIDLFVKLIKFSNVRILKFFDSCLKNKVITKDFLLENNQLLYDINLFNKFFNNITSLMSIGIPLNNKLIQMIFSMDNEYLNYQLNILNEYNIDICDENFSSYELFKNNELLDYLDQFIELGYKDCILKNPKYLNNVAPDTIKRIMVAQLIGLSPLNNSGKFIGIITTGNGFYVGPDEYNKFIIDYKVRYQNPICLDILTKGSRNIISSSTKNNPIIKALDDAFMKDSLYYIIEGVIISRNRVMRNFELLFKNSGNINVSIYDLLYQAILYNMVNNVSDEKLEEIYNCICSISFDKDKIYLFN